MNQNTALLTKSVVRGAQVGALGGAGLTAINIYRNRNKNVK
jgi:hypothetical protein